MNYPRTQRNTKGFTLIEIMVSVSIFAIIMVTGMGALVSITQSYKASRTESASMNSVHFAIDSMIRDIRLGDSYYAGDFTPVEDFSNNYNYKDGVSKMLNFIGIPSRGHLRYTFDEDQQPLLERYQNIKGKSFNFPLIHELSKVKVYRGLFRVTGSNPTDLVQPSVFIYLRGAEADTGSEFIIQTFVSQRSLDI